MATPKRYSYHVEAPALESSGRPRKFLEALAAILEHGSYGVALDTYARMSAKCSRCASACQLYETTGAPEDIPCHRSELLMRIYRRYFMPSGVLKARVFGGFTLTDAYLDQMAEAFYRCTACRRCKASCPIGIDHGLVTHLARWALAEVGIIPRALVVSVREQLDGKTGNTSAIPLPALKDTCEFLEEELHDIYHVDIDYPFDVEGCGIRVLPGGVGLHHGGRHPHGKRRRDARDRRLVDHRHRQLRRHQLRSLLQRPHDGADREAEWSRRSAAWRGRKILIGECGHATRSAWYVPTFAGPDAPEVVNCLEYTHRMLEAGRIPLKPERIPERVTYHDPCNIARVGRITEQPREILKAICADYVEMTPNRTENYCCGGGGGTVSIDEIRPFRTGLMGRRKADQIRDTGAQIVVSPCANCKKQLRELCQDNDLGDVEVVGLHDLLLRAIDFPDASVEEG